MGTTGRPLERLHKLHRDISRAKTIAVVGGGAIGDLPLSPGMIPGARKQAKVELERMNVKLVPNSTVTSTVKKAAGVVAVEVKDKNGKASTVEAGMYIPATGVTPNTSFVPADMLDSKGQIKQSKTLQAESYPDIFVAGEAGSLEASKAQMAGIQAVHIVKSLPGYVLRGEAVPEHAVDTKNTIAVTLGRSKGTGQFGKWKLPSFMVWSLKGRNLFTEGLGAFAAGKNTISTTYEK
ncbi:Pyridine nucleotide-disulfide oxidoreductase NAD-binding domain [Fusarium acutatum]|uniref:Pyridine nucleotide-disulfide oxidoreductase NAD-binding domain n=1 Tax=Fusarium acutatum TaxID=78861 RepID=A0A8H4JXE4_9HYPO|nr:Pyridine nucleotide-disulfide oxidoreductase NAD-binding domain [Fusarium acutatum]